MFDRESVGWKMVYRWENIEKSTFIDQNIRTVYMNIHAVYLNKTTWLPTLETLH